MAVRDKVKMVSTAGTGYFYVVTKNRRNQQGKLQFKKYCRFCRHHTPHKEVK